MKLTDTQIDYIGNMLRDAGADWQPLHEDLLDHICCSIEHSPQSEFLAALDEALIKFGGIPAIGILQRQTKIALQHRENIKRKILVYRIGYISAFLLTVGVAFMLMKWPGASVILLAGLIATLLVFMPLHLYRRHKLSKQDKLTL